MRDRDCVEFLQWALPRMGMRWAGFRKVRRQVCRRIARRLREEGLRDLVAYRERLERDPTEWEILDGLCRVTISRFFRDRGVWEALREAVLPALAARARREGRGGLAVWSAGCASGEEPYSLAILWRLGLGREAASLDLEITATDVDRHLLDRARRGCYPRGSLREVPERWRNLAFTRRGEHFHLRPAFRAAVDYRHHDLRRSTPPGPFDLVFCRNLAFTYYDEETQRRVLAAIGAALRPQGVLVLGRHEGPPEPNAVVEALKGAPSCYRRRSAGVDSRERVS